jgi:hypothetical protein
VVAAQNQEEESKVHDTLTPSDVGELFFEGDKIVWNYLDKHSLGYFSLENPIRAACVHIMLNKWFDRFIFLSICANAAMLAADNPMNDDNDELFVTMEIIFNTIFLIEFLIKILCLGAWGKMSGYFRESWNRLDCTVLVFSIWRQRCQ